jgi:uncharacterized protein YciI
VTFDSFSICLLILRPDAPRHDEAEAAALQEAHMSYLADLHDAGHLLACGPLDEPEYRGLAILGVDVETARELVERDPAVRAGRFATKVIPWMVPGGAIGFSPAHFPRTLAEVVAAP